MSWDVVFDNSRPVARKRHRCETCWRHIEPGEKYHRQTGKYEGEFCTRADCLFCQRAWREMYACIGSYEEWADLFDWLGEGESLAALFYCEAIDSRWAYCRPAPRLAPVTP